MLKKTGAHFAHSSPPSTQDAQGFLLDWDGCCAIGNRLVPEAADFLREQAPRCAIVSNNSTNTVEEFRDMLKGEGIAMRPDQIVLAGTEALLRAAEIRASRTLILGDPRMRAIARKLGVELAQEEAELVVLLRDTRFSYRRLERAVNAVSNGARLVVANPDTTHPGTDGRLMPETGALLSAIKACVEIPRGVVEVVGKPSPRLFSKGCAALDLPPAQVLMIGDNPQTDIQGAEALGMQTRLVDSPPGVFFHTLRQQLKSA
ncbi:HAD-IIA family hydrolase [Henriciella aquimarina]|uniref:HAD-IIA family hydrolase n=1 Tax=Henriciella aquimarina TaxID=545261 RepID=UPI000A031A22|nr:HAD hydrolase-like protein [Henriciella aquimarina]